MDGPVLAVLRVKASDLASRVPAKANGLVLVVLRVKANGPGLKVPAKVVLPPT